MREIKFRAWDKEKRKYDLLDSFYELQKWNRNDKEIKKYIIEQYTGLKDKNGKEIYEGDIVMFGYKYIVEYNECGYFPFIDEYHYFNYKPRDCEIIGNIHENSELLQGE